MKVVDFPNNNQLEANVADLERNFEAYVKMVRLSAQLKYETFKGYIDAGFTEEQALVLIQQQY